jgi:hypothetical protein
MVTAEQKIKYQILLEAIRHGWLELELGHDDINNVDELFQQFIDDLWDAKNEFRQGEFETDIKCDYSRHYESKSVAAKLWDGSWVGWTYWYGGGKHGEPEAIDWMDEAYFLDCVEEEKLVVVRTFSKAE